ncbi:MAG: RtcB family protein, partial [Thiomargarita sp.]|nr:RtcB family protein [Thiomargarita sp.]
MPIKMVLNTSKVPVKIYTEEVASKALDQLKDIANLPFIHNHIAAMPDVHPGIGTTVGAVIPTKGAIIPAAVGVDIGCGMTATRLSINASKLPENLKRVRLAIEAAVPVGFAMHKSIYAKNSTIKALNKVLEEQIIATHPAIAKMMKNPYRTWTQQLGSLGGGNHFIELCLDEHQDVWVMLHSGSRGIGNVIGRYFISLAKKDMEQHTIHLPNHDLAYFTKGAQHFEDYVTAVHWAQEYALFNRREMMRLIIEALRTPLPPFEITKEAINCHHNYV